MTARSAHFIASLLAEGIGFTAASGGTASVNSISQIGPIDLETPVDGHQSQIATSFIP